MANRAYDKSWTESWKTPAIREAEAQMEAVVRKVDKTLADVKKLRIAPTPPLSEQDLRRIEEAAKSSTAPRELRELQKRVDSGELTWRGIVDGKHLEDPGVRAAMLTNVSRLRRVYSKFMEGYDLDEVLKSERPQG